jgi:hypothetical protein
MVYCPVMYTKALSNVWQDKSQFTQLPKTPSEFIHSIPDLVPFHLYKRYSWGIHMDAKIPYGYVL